MIPADFQKFESCGFAIANFKFSTRGIAVAYFKNFDLRKCGSAFTKMSDLRLLAVAVKKFKF